MHTSILGQVENDNAFRIEEALNIIMEEKQKLLNKDRGIAIADCWAPLLHSTMGHWRRIALAFTPSCDL